MKLQAKIRFSTIITGLLIGGSIYAQGETDSVASLRDHAVRIFIDCDRCDMNYIREEIPYVNYVRDVREAQVYLRETSQRTGSGGREYSFTFLGQADFQGMNDTLIYSSRPDDTRDFVRKGRTDMMKMGLMRYVAKTPLANEVRISTNTEAVPQEVTDRWNNWVFSLEISPGYQGEDSYKRLEFENRASISKITEKWKVEIDYQYDYRRTTYTIEGETTKASRTGQELENLVVKSIGEHWAAGTRIDMQTSSFSNYKFRIDFFPSIEYNLFPYSESTHRQMRFLYGLGNSFSMYNDTTIYNLMRENRLQQKLQVAYRVEEKWGSVNVSLEGNNYFHDISKSRIELNGYISIRIIKGLSLGIFGSVARVNDQLALVKSGLDEQAVLLRLRELETNYEFRGMFGIEYTFGSIYNNIVNPRFGNGGGGGRGGGGGGRR